MKDRPILFSAPMVRAILAGTKTQTRRAVKHEAPDEADGCCSVEIDGVDTFCWVTGEAQDIHPSAKQFPCPYGQPGDRLWVRETFFAWGRWETRYSAKKGRDEWHFVDMTLECGKAYEYPATGGQPQPMGGARHRGGTTPTWWKRPAIHMPRAASRITLEITSVRVDRLQDAWNNDADCIAEGIEEMPRHPSGTRLWRNYLPGHPQAWSPNLATPGNSFSTLWRSINGDASWDANPWVWAITFKRIESTT